MQSAQTLPPRAVEVAVEPTHVATRSSSSKEDTAPLGLSIRLGLDPRTEIGLRTGFAAPSIQIKRMLSTPDARNAVSFAPSLGAIHSDLHGIALVSVYGQLPLLVGLPTGRHVEWVVAPKLLWTATRGLQSPTWGLLVGGGASGAVGIRVYRSNWLMPELTAVVPLLYANENLAGSGGGIALQASVALRVGGGRR